MDSGSVPAPSTTTTTESNSKVDDDDIQAVFLNSCIERESIDFEKSVEDKRKANINGNQSPRLTFLPHKKLRIECFR